MLLDGIFLDGTETTVVGILQELAQTKESVRRDKRPSCLYCVSVSCLYCERQNICWLAPACLPSVALLVYFQKQLLAYFRKHLLAYFQKHLSRVCAPSLPPSPTQGMEGQGMEGEEVGKELVGAIEVVQINYIRLKCIHSLFFNL